MKLTHQYRIALRNLLYDLHLNLYRLPTLNPKTYRKIFGKLNLTSSFITSWSIRLTSKSFLSLDINTCTKVSGADAPAVKPICDKNNKFLQKLKGKPTIVVNFLEGKSKNNVTIDDCNQVGSSMGLMHLFSKDFELQRDNSLSIKGWQTLIKNCNNSIPVNVLDKLQPNLMKDIKNSFDFLVKFWPHDLPKGFIHGDFFPDNVFFVNNKITGVIDFYFSCTDILAYDLAIAINAWCFDKQYNFQDKKYQALLKGYNSKRKLSKDEEFFLPLLCQAASLRFLLTRLFDWVNTPIEANVVLKNPEEYITKHKYFKKLVKNIKYVEN